MRLFVFGRRRGRQTDQVIERAGVRLHTTHWSRVQTARHELALVRDAQATAAANRPDLGADGELDYLERGRV